MRNQILDGEKKNSYLLDKGEAQLGAYIQQQYLGSTISEWV